MNKFNAHILCLMISLGVSSSANSDDTPAINFAEVSASTPSCGKGGKTPYVKNKHSSKSISVNLHVKYEYNGQARDEDVGDWTLNPGQVKKLTSRCTIPGPTNQTFNYYAGSAKWL